MKVVLKPFFSRFNKTYMYDLNPCSFYYSFLKKKGKHFKYRNAARVSFSFYKFLTDFREIWYALYVI